MVRRRIHQNNSEGTFAVADSPSLSVYANIHRAHTCSEKKKR